MLPHSVACLLGIVLPEGIKNILMLADRKHGSRNRIVCGGNGQRFLYPDLQITADRTQKRLQDPVLSCLRNAEVKSQVMFKIERHVGHRLFHPRDGVLKLVNIPLGGFSRREV